MNIRRVKPVGRVITPDTTAINVAEEVMHLVSDVSISLPTEKTVPLEGIQNYAIYIYGPAGIGKTAFTSMFPNAFHLFYEPSGDALSMYAKEPANWKEFLGYIALLEDQKRSGTLKFETVILDVVDLCFQQCIKYVCEPMGVDWPPSDYGKTWNKIKSEFRDALYRLKRVTGLVMVSHSTAKATERMDGQKYDTLVPTITNSGNDVISKFCGMQCFYTMKSDGRRILVIDVNTCSEAKNRVKGHFLYSDGSRMSEVPMGNSEEESWKNFNLAYNNKFKRPKPTVTVTRNKPT